MSASTVAFPVLRWVSLLWIAVWLPAYVRVWGWPNLLHLRDIAEMQQIRPAPHAHVSRQPDRNPQQANPPQNGKSDCTRAHSNAPPGAPLPAQPTTRASFSGPRHQYGAWRSVDEFLA